MSSLVKLAVDTMRFLFSDVMDGAKSRLNGPKVWQLARVCCVIMCQTPVGRRTMSSPASSASQQMSPLARQLMESLEIQEGNTSGMNMMDLDSHQMSPRTSH